MTPERTHFEILVAEDNPTDIRLVREALKQCEVDCTLHIPSDGLQAMNFINRLDADPKVPRLDLLLLDMHPPKHDVEDTLKCLRSTEPYAQVRVVVNDQC